MGGKKLGCVLAALAVLMLSASPAPARSSFKPRIGDAMGIVPLLGHQELAAGIPIPLAYHGGSVMRNATIHTIFWAPSGFAFDGPPAGAGAGYEQLIQQFFTDVARDSGAAGNVFSVLPQYADGTGPGSYRVSYNAATDSTDDADPYPTSPRCASPAGIATCLTDLQLQREIDKVIRAHDPSGRGLHDVWFVFLPPDVDTCVLPGSCGTTVFAGYHALSNAGRGRTVYAVIPDPLIELTPPPGSDPQGNPEAEAAINVSAHEAVEALTDPQGTGWMDPNGFEVGDKCETQQGRPLGSAADGSPFNQVIGGDRYLLQMMWSNSANGCVQRSSSTTSPLPLATVNLRQFSPLVSGNVGARRPGVPVTVVLSRAGAPIAFARAFTGAGGGWGPVALQSLSGGLHAVGDDRDEILVDYGSSGLSPDLIETGDGGNPFTQAGWTGWFDLDHGYAVGSSAILLGPCSQTGVLGVTVGGVPTSPPIEQCETESNVAIVPTPAIHAGTSVVITSEDNRAVWIGNPNGALVNLTIPAGEPHSVSSVSNNQVLFNPTGFPSCTADLRTQSVRCTGLVPHARYDLVRRRRHAVRRGRAARGGSLTLAGFPGAQGIVGGDLLTLANGSGRTLTTLHVAHLRVDLVGNQTVVSKGTCQAGDYWGAPLGSPPLSLSAAVPGVGGTGMICPPDGRAGGLSAERIAQTDDRSGGQTRTELPLVEGTSPIDGETLYGLFIAQARTGLPGLNGSVITTHTRVSLTITRSTSGRPVFRAGNVDMAAGVAVRALAPGTYTAKWVVLDVNGDTRTVVTHFVEA